MHDKSDISMLCYWNFGERLVTRELASIIAHHLVLTKFGQSGLDEQLPFVVSETEVEWLVRGSKLIVEQPVPGKGPVFGAVELRISKRDCKVLSFEINGEFP